jgi:3-oxoacyl-[acyl-carrier protein] reductase
VTYYREPCRCTEEEMARAREAGISYAVSKHAIESYSRSAAAEIGQYGVTVNEDVADIIVLLASEQARWLTGQLLYVGGGWRMHQ